MNGSKIFMTGATGVLGKRVARLLTADGFQIKALSRSEKNDTLINDLGAEPVRVDLFNENELIKATSDCESIFHLATSIPQKALPVKKSDWEMNDRIRTEGTGNLLRAAGKNNIKKFIQQSVTYLYGNRNGEFVDSSTPVAEKLPFMIRSAVEMEHQIRQTTNVDHIITRFGQFYSADSFNTVGLIESIKRKKMPLIGNGDFYWNTIHVDDATSATFYCYRNFERLKNRTVNFTDFNPLPFRKILEDLSLYFHLNKPTKIPGWLARILLNKDLYRFVTASYRVKKEDIITDWDPVYSDFIKGMKSIIDMGKTNPGD